MDNLVRTFSTLYVKYGRDLLVSTFVSEEIVVFHGFDIYYHHWNKIVALDAEAHVNTCFKHFYFFAKVGKLSSNKQEFELVDEKDMEPAQKLGEKIESLKKTMVDEK